jgi:hypothetical protein
MYHPEDGLEVMHGTGLRLSSHTVGKDGEEAFAGGCVKAVALALKEKASFKPSEKNMAALSAIFGDGVNGRVFICTHSLTCLPITKCGSSTK